MNTEVRMGIYRHYKGPLYLVLGLAHDANADELYVHDPYGGLLSHHELLGKRTVVVYVPLQLDGAHLGPRMAVRTLADFQMIVCADSKCERYGMERRLRSEGGPCWAKNSVSRFEYLGPELTPEMIR